MDKVICWLLSKFWIKTCSPNVKIGAFEFEKKMAQYHFFQHKNWLDIWVLTGQTSLYILIKKLYNFQISLLKSPPKKSSLGKELNRTWWSHTKANWNKHEPIINIQNKIKITCIIFTRLFIINYYKSKLHTDTITMLSCSKSNCHIIAAKSKPLSRPSSEPMSGRWTAWTSCPSSLILR